MDLIGAVIGGLSLGLFMAISVGPTLFAIIRYSLNHSYKTGLAFVLGVSLSDVLYVTVANLATPWLEMLHRFEKWLAYGGGILLMVIGLLGFLKKYKPVRPKRGIKMVTSGHYLRIFVSGFLINTINPGVVINWLAAAAAVATKGTLFRIVFFGSCLGLVLGLDFLKVFAADSIRKKLTLRRIMYLQKTSSFLLFGAGVLLILAAAFSWIELG
jgi:threonine/homoserine/homoserine lactone efflux protein